MRGVVTLSLAALMASVTPFATLPPVCAAPAPAIRLAPKPLDRTTDRRARRQPSVPSTYEEMPFVETATEPALTPAEKQRGYLLFHRPITEPVYPNSRPLANERLEQLVAFATPGEFEPLTFSIYPVRRLQDLKVRCSSLICDAGEIPAIEVTVRLVTYWNVGYPRYTSRSTYRRTLLDPGSRAQRRETGLVPRNRIRLGRRLRKGH
jgi:hypothetical protein